MSLISIYIKDDGQHWDKTIKICGISVYHRHDFTKSNSNCSYNIGFSVKNHQI